ncbi:GatB/YqeY domain-containing protein [Natronosporangium hydrolyticum]|uniref:GatB/YqeY domain-containing protein n=1 Tax=Natronosporangium hydrolyticum TaxID=2811111 RepID=A0A895Y9W1_9ACTN|nr:GatB/YqeY domain-containing protein [Natronosporangium hydrolyticum]QSB14554.1 GatB/YqeY domain-containing protein [Natronosporangium hydrolyticum]
MGTLKEQLTTDLRTAMKAREQLTTETLRMLLSAVRNEEVAEAAARELSDDEVSTVLTREARKRREAADAYQQAGRVELADRERAELSVVERYLPAQLSDEEVAELVAAALTDGGFQGAQAMGPAMKAARAAVAGRADGARVAAEVRRQLGG